MAKYVKRNFIGYQEAKDEYDHVVMSLHEFEEMKQELVECKRNLMAAKSDVGKWKAECAELKEARTEWKKYAESLEERALPEGMIVVSEQEYAGYQNALRIIRDRALQQVEKSKADEHGYMLVRMEQRKYGNKEKAWMITKRTPYSLKIGTNEAFFLIQKDLEAFYHFRELPVIPTSSYGQRLTEVELLDYHERFFKNGEKIPYGNSDIEFILKWIQELKGKIIFEIRGLSSNVAVGCYEVTYWATEPI